MLPSRAANSLTWLAPSTFLRCLMWPVTSPQPRRGRRVWGLRWHHRCWLISLDPGVTRARDNSNNDPPSLHCVPRPYRAGIFPLSRVIDRVSDRNYKKLDEDIFVARSHTWSQSSRAGGRPSHFQASLHICWWWASANVIFSWLLFYWLRISAWLASATGLMLPHIRQLQLGQSSLSLSISFNQFVL